MIDYSLQAENDLDQGSEDPGVKSSPLPILATKSYWNTATCMVHGCFCVTTELRSRETVKPGIFIVWPFTENLCQPLMQVVSPVTSLFVTPAHHADHVSQATLQVSPSDHSTYKHLTLALHSELMETGPTSGDVECTP